MSIIIKGIVNKGVVVTNTTLPEGAIVEIHLIADEARSANLLLHFHGHLDPYDPLELEFVEELARRRREDLEQTLLEDS